jgi:DNA polymerase III alpha subunit
MEFFSGYGFNLSHAVCYSILSYQCAYLFHYYPAEWLAAFLDKEPEERKEAAIASAKSFGFNVRKVDINSSGVKWEVDASDPKTLIQPLSSIKGLGETAVEQIMKYRPFKTVEELLFHPEVTYSKLNKKALDSLTRSEALDCLVDKRFTGLKHFWSAVVVDRPKNIKKLEENVEKYKPEGDFTLEEKIDNLTSLSGIYPVNLVMDPQILKRLEEKYIPAIGEYEQELGEVVWFIPRNITEKKTKNGKIYWVLEVTDITNKLTNIKCWGIDPKKDKVWTNRPYLGKLQHDDWGFSTRSIKYNFKLLG